MKPKVRQEDLIMVNQMQTIAETLVKSEWEKKYLRQPQIRYVEDKIPIRKKRFNVVKEDLGLIYD